MKVTRLEDLIRWRRHLHKNPELSQKEYKTAAYIRAELDKMDLTYETCLNSLYRWRGTRYYHFEGRHRCPSYKGNE